MKKIMKRFSIVLIVIATCCISLFGCSSQPPESYGEPQGYYLYMGFYKCLEDGSDVQYLVEEVADGDQSYEILRYVEHYYEDDTALFVVQDERENYCLVKYDLIEQEQETIYIVSDYFTFKFVVGGYIYIGGYDSDKSAYTITKLDYSGNVIEEDCEYIGGGKLCGDSIIYLDNEASTTTICVTNIASNEVEKIDLDKYYDYSVVVGDQFYAYSNEKITSLCDSYTRQTIFVYEESTGKSLSIDEQFEGKQINYREEFFMVSTPVEKNERYPTLTFEDCVLYMVNDDMQIEEIMQFQSDIDFTSFSVYDDNLVAVHGEKACIELFTGYNTTRYFDSILISVSDKCVVIKEDYYESIGDEVVDGVSIDNYIFYIEFSSNGLWIGSYARYVMRYDTITKLHECMWYKSEIYDDEYFAVCYVTK